MKIGEENCFGEWGGKLVESGKKNVVERKSVEESGEGKM